MKRKGFAAEQIIRMLREAEVHSSQRKSVKLVGLDPRVTKQTFYRWR